MSNSQEWTANDYSNFITICAAAIGSTLLVLFKSRCINIKFCCGIFECIRDVKDVSSESDEESIIDKKNIIDNP
jgi:hypothetical protein